MNNHLSPAEQAIQKNAITFAKKNKKKLAKHLANIDIYKPEADPVSVFMAGSPGAGKTETAKALLSAFESSGNKILRIDVDDVRDCFEGYNGSNSHLVQAGANILIEAIHDHAIKYKQSFIFDGTFAHYDKANLNIQRSLKRNRTVQILYVYLDPKQAWEFVKARETVEGRRILPELFVKQYFEARDVVNRIKAEFGKDIRIDLLVKNLDGSNRFYRDNIDKIDNYLVEKYDKSSILNIVNTFDKDAQ